MLIRLSKQKDDFKTQFRYESITLKLYLILMLNPHSLHKGHKPIPCLTIMIELKEFMMEKRSFPSVFVNVFAAASIIAIIMLITLGSFSRLQQGAEHTQTMIGNEINDPY